MTSVADFLADQAARPTIERDNFGRYLLPDPNTGKRRAWTRATTWARVPSDSFGITRWQLRMCARGLAARPDLVLRLLSEYSDDTVADKVIADAQEHAGSTVAATSGTAMHRFTELVDAGDELPPLPPSAAGDLTAYTQALAAHRLAVTHIERIVCVPSLGVAGTIDRVLTRDLDAWIADLKTGADLTHSWAEIAVQLALYAHGEAMWNATEQAWEPMPPVDQVTALVMHLPLARGECTIYEVDIMAGWEAATELCGLVRRWRNRGRDLATPVEPPPAPAVSTPDPPDPESLASPQGDRAGWVTSRLRALAADERARTLVGQGWPEGVTVRPPWSMAEVDALAALLDKVEAEVGAPFGASDPATPRPQLAAVPDPPERRPPWRIADDGVVAEAEDIDALGADLATRPAAALVTVRRWAQQAKAEGRAFDGPSMTRRMWSCARAAIACAVHLVDEDRVRRALAITFYDPEQVDGEPIVLPLPDTWLTGAVIGSLDVHQAEDLADLATSYGAGNSPYLDPL